MYFEASEEAQRVMSQGVNQGTMEPGEGRLRRVMSPNALSGQQLVAQHPLQQGSEHRHRLAVFGERGFALCLLC